MDTSRRIPMDENEMRAHTQVFRERLAPIRDAIGQEAFNQFGLELAEKYEDYLRREQPHSRLLVLLDLHRQYGSEGAQ